MGKHEWFGPAIERLSELMKMPAIANEYGCRKVEPEAVHELMTFLLNNMPSGMEAPRIMPMGDGGLTAQWEEYWVDLTLLVQGEGGLSVFLGGGADWFEHHGAAGEEVGPKLFAEAVGFFERLKKEGPPEKECWRKDGSPAPEKLEFEKWKAKEEPSKSTGQKTD